MNLNMKRILNMTLTILGVFGVAAAFTPNASAGCGDVASNAGVVNAQLFSMSASSRVMPFRLAADKPQVDGASVADELQPAGASIVGMWQFNFVSNGVVLDAGFSQWHSDGTEITNSSRPPATGNFCLGVWERTGPRTYKLNHKGLSFDSNGQFIGPASIRLEVTIDRNGNTYSGTFTIDQFDNANHLLAHIAGDVTAQRVTVD
jgi:hypothetical protein